MTGTKAEQNLLGAVILDSRQFSQCVKRVSGADFTDARMGIVWDAIAQVVSRGEPIDAALVDANLGRWGVRGLDVEAFSWADASVYVFAAPEYADAVRAASVARQVRNVVNVTNTYLNEGEVPQDIATKAHRLLSEIIDDSGSGSLATKTLEEILRGVDTYDWIIPGLLERMDRLIVTGPEGSGKTTWVRQLAVLSAAGIHPTTFKKIDPVNVLVVDAENTERQWRRAVRWTVRRAQESGSVDPAPNVNIVAGNRIDITKGSHLSEIHRLIDRHKPDVVFIGPLYKLVPKAINNDDDAAPLIVALDSIRERNVALVMEAHAGKAANAAGDRDLRPRGSSALLGWPEFGFGLRPDPDAPGEVQVSRWRGDRDERDWPKRMIRGVDWPWEPIIENN